MNESRLKPRPSATVPLLAFLLASAAGVVLVGLRIVWTGNITYLFLVWNLFLAWVPLLLALRVSEHHGAGVCSGWKLLALGAMWLCFFPNAPYIFTDFIHLNTWFRGHYWFDLTLILLIAFTGFMLGFVSLYLMQSVVAERFGRRASWWFILAVAALSGFGIYLGRFLRWNSWDVVLHPMGLSRDIGRLAAHPLANARPLVFQAMFAIFLFLGYVMLYALTHLQPARSRNVAA